MRKRRKQNTKKIVRYIYSWNNLIYRCFQAKNKRTSYSLIVIVPCVVDCEEVSQRDREIDKARMKKNHSRHHHLIND